MKPGEVRKARLKVWPGSLDSVSDAQLVLCSLDDFESHHVVARFRGLCGGFFYTNSRWNAPHLSYLGCSTRKDAANAARDISVNPLPECSSCLIQACHAFVNQGPARKRIVKAFTRKQPTRKSSLE